MMEYRTPAHKDKHIFMSLLFAAVVVLNHKWQLNLSPGELGILGTVFGAYMGQSQLAAWARLQTLIAPERGSVPDAK